LADFRTGLLRRLFIRVERRMAHVTSRFVFVSRSEKHLATSVFGITEPQACIVENGIPSSLGDRLRTRSSACEALGIDKPGLAVAVPGRQVHQKGQDWFLHALTRVCMEDTPLHVYFCGAGPDEAQLRKMAKRLGVAAHVTWLGHVTGLAEYLAAFDLVVLPARYEGLPYILLETLCAGVPMIVSDIEGHFPRDEIREHALAVPLEDEEALGQALIRFAADPSSKPSDPGWGKRFVTTHFTVDTQAEKLLSCYRELMEGRPAQQVEG